MKRWQVYGLVVAIGVMGLVGIMQAEHPVLKVIALLVWGGTGLVVGWWAGRPK